MKRIRLVLCMLCLLSLTFSLPAQAAGETLRQSGAAGLAPLSRVELAELAKSTIAVSDGNPYVRRPDLTDLSSAGRLKGDALQGGLDRLNHIRRLAGLPAVSWDADYVDMAQAAAYVNAANDALSHFPALPDGMDSDLYQLGYTAAGHSSLAYFYGYDDTNPLATSVDMWMADSDESNIASLGHRRWLLNPTMRVTGFGCANNMVGGTTYTAAYVFDQSGEKVDYDFIAWPASGLFPVTEGTFTPDHAWSVTLNPQTYAIPALGSVTVTLTRQSDGREWTFRHAGKGGGKTYFNIDTSNYGTGTCIIFRPDGITSYEGVYTVRIDGLRNRTGAVDNFTYQVEFFSADPQFHDVSLTAWYEDYVFRAVMGGLLQGLGGHTFAPAANLTTAQAVTLAARLHAQYNGGTVPQAKAGQYWYQPAYDYCVSNGLITTGEVPLSSMDQGISRCRMVSILDRAVPDSEKAVLYPNAAAPDVGGSDPYASVVLRWYRAGITQGDERHNFNGASSITRAETAALLCRLTNLSPR